MPQSPTLNACLRVLVGLNRPLVITAVMLLVTGCKTTTAPDPGLSNEDRRALYGRVRARQDLRVSGISRFWARSVVEAKWTEADGRKRFEQGDGHLILSFPDRAALTVGKLGDVKFWAGSDGKQYWLFDLLNANVLQYGQISVSDHKGVHAGQPSLLLVKPNDFPQLLGLLPLPPLPADAGDNHTRVDSNIITIDLPGRRTRMTFDAKTLRPINVTLLNKNGKPIITSDLSNYDRMEKENAAIGPYVPRTIQLKMADREGSLTVYLNDATDLERRVKDRLFDLEFLTKTLKPKQIVNLDEPARQNR